MTKGDDEDEDEEEIAVSNRKRKLPRGEPHTVYARSMTHDVVGS